MTTEEYELGMAAHDTYAWARASDDPLTKQKLLNLADGYLRQADELRRQNVTQASWPKGTYLSR